MSNLTLRILTAVVGVPLILGITYLGGGAFVALVAVAALASQFEFYELAEKGGIRPLKGLGLVLGLAAVLRFILPEAAYLLLVGVLLAVALVPFRTDDRPIASTSVLIAGVIYPAALLAYLIPIRNGVATGMADAEAFVLTITVFLLIWSADTFAYFVGKSIGKHPMAPKVSPKKTWEGALGGAAGALLVAAVLRLTVLDFLAWPHVLVVAVICGIVSQIGDLAESKMKRSVGAKDSGRLLPGHGGVLDRLDALILAAPLVYAYLSWVGVFSPWGAG